MFAVQSDFLFDTGRAGALESVTETLPDVVTRDATIVVRGEPQFKSRPKITCPRCHEELQPGEVTLRFRHATADRASQAVEGFVCECGETFVPGKVAREAHHRAFAPQGAACATNIEPDEVLTSNRPNG